MIEFSGNAAGKTSIVVLYKRSDGCSVLPLRKRYLKEDSSRVYWCSCVGLGADVLTSSTQSAHWKWFRLNHQVAAAIPKKTIHPHTLSATYGFCKQLLAFWLWPMDLRVDKTLESSRIVYPSVSALCPSAMTLCQCVGTVTVCSAATIWPFLVCNVSV